MGSKFSSCLPSRKTSTPYSERYDEIHNDFLKEKLLNSDNMTGVNDKIRALETKMELRRYEVDMALQYISEKLNKSEVIEEEKDL